MNLIALNDLYKYELLYKTLMRGSMCLNTNMQYLSKMANKSTTNHCDKFEKYFG